MKYSIVTAKSPYAFNIYWIKTLWKIEWPSSSMDKSFQSLTQQRWIQREAVSMKTSELGGESLADY